MRAVHTKGGQTQTSLHKGWLGGIFTLRNCPARARVFGLEVRRSTSELRPPSKKE